MNRTALGPTMKAWIVDCHCARPRRAWGVPLTALAGCLLALTGCSVRDYAPPTLPAFMREAVVLDVPPRPFRHNSLPG